MGQPLDGAPACALTLVMVMRQMHRIERELEVQWCEPGGAAVPVDADLERIMRLHLAAELLEAALIYHAPRFPALVLIES